ncbi:MAG: PHP domain-containing protein [Bacteriovoracaceae bacterium]|nr:PHP domain-containing protein [Bacteriovoracaceae bacterium]
MSITIAVDAHCHSVASGHALCTIQEIIELTYQRGLQGVAITDHHPSLAHKGDKYVAGAPDDLYFYVLLKRYQNMFEQVKLYKGIELNILDKPPWVCELSSFSGDFDIKIAGIHPFSHLYNPTTQRDRNTDILLKAIGSGDKPLFKILAHPALDNLPVDIEAVTKACIERDIALEVNNSNILYRKESIKPISTMLKVVKKFGGKIAVGSDAHVPHEVGNLTEAIKLLEECEFPQELIVNGSLLAFDDFIGH